MLQLVKNYKNLKSDNKLRYITHLLKKYCANHQNLWALNNKTCVVNTCTLTPEKKKANRFSIVL